MNLFPNIECKNEWNICHCCLSMLKLLIINKGKTLTIFTLPIKSLNCGSQCLHWIDLITELGEFLGDLLDSRGGKSLLAELERSNLGLVELKGLNLALSLKGLNDGLEVPSKLRRETAKSRVPLEVRRWFMSLKGRKCDNAAGVQRNKGRTQRTREPTSWKGGDGHNGERQGQPCA